MEPEDGTQSDIGNRMSKCFGENLFKTFSTNILKTIMSNISQQISFQYFPEITLNSATNMLSYFNSNCHGQGPQSLVGCYPIQFQPFV